MMDQDDTHAWRYGNGPYPAQDGIRVTIEFRGYKAPSVFEHFGVIDPANGGHPASLFERGMIRRIEIEAI